MTALMKALDAMNEEELEALLAAMNDPDYWLAFDRRVAAGGKLRSAVEAGRDAFTRDEMIAALNYVEATRQVSHVVIGMAAANLAQAKMALSSAICTWCEWKYRDELFDWPADRTVTPEDIVEVNVRVGAQLREHIKVCPSHPMRALEAQLAAALGGG